MPIYDKKNDQYYEASYFIHLKDELYKFINQCCNGKKDKFLQAYTGYTELSGFFSSVGYGIFTNFWYHKTNERRDLAQINLIDKRIKKLSDEYDKCHALP